MPFEMSSYRADVIRIGVGATTVANGIFAASRYFQQLSSGTPTPWWCNAAASIALLLTYLWYLRDPPQRASAAIHVTAAAATVALVVPLAYGLESSIWWLSLVAIAMELMANIRAAVFWCVVEFALVLLVPGLLARFGPIPSVAEPELEGLLSRVVFLLLVVGIAFAFRVAVRRQAAYSDDVGRARSLRRMAADLEFSSLAKDRFLQHMSHEFRTPMHGVIARTDQALHQQLDDAQRHRSGGANACALVLLQQIEDVLEYASQGLATSKLEHRDFNALEIAEQVLFGLDALALAKDVKLTLGADAGWVEPRVGDPKRFRQIVHKLASNAVRFTQRGAIDVRVGEQRAGSDGMVLTVSDSGIGMTTDQLSRLFQPFPRGNSTSTREVGGLGLGLAMVKALAERTGGSIECQSVASVGTQVTVCLGFPASSEVDTQPVMTQHESRLPRKPAMSGIGVEDRLRVLVCDDDLICQSLLAESLRLLGHKADTSDNGQIAWDLLAIAEFDVVITDIEMPGLDGTSLLRLIRERDDKRGVPLTPVMAATARSPDRGSEGVRPDHFDAWLPKPFQLAELQENLALLAPLVRLRQAVDNRR